AYDASGRRILTLGFERAGVWRAGDDRLAAEIPSDAGPIAYAAFRPDDRALVSTGADNKVHLWDVQGRPLGTIQPEWELLNTAVCSPDGSRLLLSGTRVGVWDATTLGWLFDLVGHESHVAAAEFSRDGHRIVTAGADQTIRIWDAGTGADLRTIHTG